MAAARPAATTRAPFWSGWATGRRPLAVAPSARRNLSGRPGTPTTRLANYRRVHGCGAFLFQLSFRAWMNEGPPRATFAVSLLGASCGPAPTTNPLSPAGRASAPRLVSPVPNQPSPSNVVVGWNAYSSPD